MASSDESRKYFIVLEGHKTYQKYSMPELEEFARNRILTPESLIYHPQKKVWVKIGQTSLKSLFERASGEIASPSEDYSKNLPKLDSYYVQTAGSNFERIEAIDIPLRINKGEFSPDLMVYNPTLKKWFKLKETHLRSLFSQEQLFPAGQSHNKSPEKRISPEIEAQFAEFSNQLALNPCNIELAIEFADLCLKLDDRNRALNALRIALEGNPYEPALVNKLKEFATLEEIEDTQYAEKEAPYYTNFVELVLKYPFLEGGLATFLFPVGIGILQLLSRISIFGLLGLIVTVALYLGWGLPFLYRILTETVDGKDYLPDWDFSYWSEGLWPTLKIIIGIALYGSPFFLMGLLMLLSRSFVLGFFIIALAIPWMLFIEPIVIIFSLYETNFLNVLNPKIMISAVIKIIGPYFLALSFIVTFAIPIVFLRIIPIPFLGAVLNFYFLIMFLRILGLMYRQNRWKLKDILAEE
ncbi:hypothetical protein JW877_00935 [bacterium]|nr:hypothetical protein [bacterium]